MASTSIPTLPGATKHQPNPGTPPPPSFRAGGRGGEGGDGFRPRPRQLPISNAVLGMGILLCSLTMLFAGLMSAYVVLRATAGSNWPPPGVPPIPSGLWASTLILLTSSVTLGWGQRAARRDDQATMKLGLVATTLLGIAFLALQTYLWRDVFLAGLTQRSQYGSLFFTLTGTHAAHVVGGVVILWCVSWRSLAGRYNATRHDGITTAAMYWHFLGVIWVGLFTVLYLVH